MKRQIKFRGKHIITGDWVYGYYVHDEEWGKHYIFSQCLIGAFYQLSKTEISEKGVGQYSGITDINGNGIYEGDICILITENSMSDMEVKFKDGQFVGEGPFNTHPLIVYVNALDFISIEATETIYDEEK